MIYKWFNQCIKNCKSLEYAIYVDKKYKNIN